MRRFADQRRRGCGRSCARSRPRAETRRGLARPRSCRGSNGSAARSRSASSASASAVRRGGVGGVDHEDQARAQSRQRHQRERTGLGVEFGRGVAVRPAVREIEGQRGLRIASAFGLDACGRAAERMAAIGADREPGDRPVRRCRADGDVGVADRHRVGLVVDQGQRGQCPRARARAPRAGAGSRCCSRRPQARSRAASKQTSGARSSRAVSSTMRMRRSGAAWSLRNAPRRRASRAP